ncbi:MAG: serine hydrolase [Nitrospirae bacterium]|nr:serine hydrolase [Nitrospirota bacterium]
MKILRTALIVSFVLIVGFSAGWKARELWTKRQEAAHPKVEMRQGGLTFTNPLLDCEMGPYVIGDAELAPFKNKLGEIIKEKKKTYGLSDVSVYFRELNNGRVFGIGQDEQFAPASLLKVPAMMTLFKQAESYPLLLTKKVKFTDRQDLTQPQHFKPSKAIQPGKSYTLEELAYMAVVYSDNNANGLLFEHLDKKILRNTYTDLVVEVPSSDKVPDFMSVKEYATFFRILYNASYLNRTMSEKALEFLAESDFRSGLVAGVPPDIKVAHKFGERVRGLNNEIKQLHDCGIVYYPGDPYLLCVMTRGSDFDVLDNVISDISYIIFDEVNDQKKKYAVK